MNKNSVNEQDFKTEFFKDLQIIFQWSIKRFDVTVVLKGWGYAPA